MMEYLHSQVIHTDFRASQHICNLLSTKEITQPKEIRERMCAQMSQNINN